jgi:drug/metabolite transporter (DMT)-like permease
LSFPAAVRAKTYIMLALVVLFSSAGNLMLSRGMKQLGPVRVGSAEGLIKLFAGVFGSGWIWLGIGSLLLFLGCYMVVLSWADYSFVAPASAAVFVVIPLVGHFLLGEKVRALQWIGILIICAGVGLVGRTKPATTNPK